MKVFGESMIRKTVITAAGIGTRLLTATKEQPKEMLPIFAEHNGTLCVKPVLQMIFEQLYDSGFREFCFIVGRGKRAIEDHFTIDRKFIKQLDDDKKDWLASTLERFYEKIISSNIVWINQPEPKGFGHAVLMAKSFIGGEPFLVHAGDTYIISNNNNGAKRLVNTHESTGADATLLLKEVKNPKQYGVADIQEHNERYYVRRAIEKPEKPPTNLAIMPVYVFNPVIMRILEKTPPGLHGEIQLTDAIQGLITGGFKVQAVKLRDDEVRLDVGTPETYWEAIATSYRRFQATKNQLARQ